MVSNSTPQAAEVVASALRSRPPHATPPPSPLTGYGSVRLLISDIRTASILANRARYWALEQLGVHPEDVNIATFVIALTLAESAPRGVKRLVSAPGHPDRIDNMFGLGLLNELVHDMGGPASRATPNFGGLVALGLVAGLTAPTVRSALREFRVIAGRTGGEFHHRYGYLIAARARRAARREAAAQGQSTAPQS